MNAPVRARLLPYRVFEGSMNMAVDEAILERAITAGKSDCVTLRFYGWRPEAVSIGYGQKLPYPDRERIVQRGFDLVKRPTGGRAVLHSGELTYSFVGHGALLGGSIAAAYDKICQGLIAGLAELGLEACLGESSDRSYRDKADCFLAITPADLKLDGFKLAGSAQLRRGDWILQHGSILLNQPQDLMPSLLQGEANGETETCCRPRHCNLFDKLVAPLTVDALVAVFSRGFEKTFSCSFVESELFKDEMELAESKASAYLIRSASIKG